MKLNNTETVTISVDEYYKLIEDSCWLAALETAGVDNWEGYDEARKIFNDWVSDVVSERV